jgi:hypothetical protein
MLDYAPRVVRVVLFDQPGGVPNELVSRPPVATAAGKSSIKNCVLIDRHDREFVWFMKLRKWEFI